MPANEKVSEKWTPEPWNVQRAPWPPYVKSSDGYSLMLSGIGYTDEKYRAEERANASRAVACVNALSGIENPSAYIAQMQADMRTLAAEVIEWRQMFAPKQPLQRVQQAYEEITKATDTSNALTRAKEIQP